MKMLFKFMLISVLLISASPLAHAQQLSDANELFDMYQFEEASKLYLRIVTKDLRGKEEATERLADCYRILGNRLEAEKYYATAVDYPSASNRINFNYGLVLRDNGKYAEAKEQFLKYATQSPGDLRGNLYASYMDQVMAWNAQAAKVEKKRHGNLAAMNAADLNTEFMDIGASRFGDKGVVFASGRPLDPKKKKRIAEKLKMWETTIDTVSGKVPTFAEAKLVFPVTRATSDLIQGPASFTADGKTMVYTQSYIVNDGYGGQIEGFEIMFSTFDGKEWSKPEPFSFNSQEFSNAHPTISSDGKMLIYTSDMPGGYGATDMYMSRLNGTRWEKPRNMGPNVNTAEIEKYPVFVHDSILYFSSNGHITLGGQDIMKSVYRNGAWTKAENMRAPINSLDDDVYFVPLRGERLALLSSARAGGKGETDIYVLCVAPAAPLVLAGAVEVQGAAAQLSLTLRDDNGKTDTLIPDAKGRYAVQVKDDHRYMLRAWAEGFSTDSAAIHVKDDNVHDTLAMRSLVLKPQAAPVTVVAEAKKEEAPAPAPQPEVKKEEPKKAEPAPQPEVKKEEAKPAEPKKEEVKAAPASQPEVKKEESKKSEPAPQPEVKKEEAKPAEPKKEEVKAAPAPQPEVKKEEPKKVEPTPQPEVKKEEAKPAEPKKEEVKAASAPQPEVKKEEPKKAEPALQPEVKKEEPKPTPAPVVAEQPKQAAPVVQQPEAKAEQVVSSGRKFKNIYFNKSSIYPAEKSYATIGNLLVYLRKNISVGVHFDVYSDAQGTESVNLEISQRRAKVLAAYMQQQGISAGRITTAAHGDAKPVNRCKPAVECSEEEHAANRRAEVSLLEAQGRRVVQPATNEEVVIENQAVSSVAGNAAAPQERVAAEGAQGRVRKFRNISYAKNSVYPDKSSYGNIGNLIVFMKNHPNAVVELDVHNDAEGSEGVNMQVSDSRAKVISSYLQQNDVDESRIVLRSHGSSRPLNRCGVGVACSEKEHAVNRRVEVRVKY